MAIDPDNSKDGRVKELESQIEALSYKLEIIDSRFEETNGMKLTLEQKLKSSEKEVSIIMVQLGAMQNENSELRSQIESLQTNNKPNISSYSFPEIIDSSESQLKSVIKFYQDETSKNSKALS